MDCPAPPHWLCTWTTALQLTEPGNLPPEPGLTGNTLRQVVQVSVSGSVLRLRLSNEFGNGPLTLEAVRLGRSDGTHRVLAATSRDVTFQGKSGITIEPGEHVTSDPVAFDLPAMTRLALTIRFGAVPTDLTGHPGSRTTSYLMPGNHVEALELPDALPTEHWYVLAGIDVGRDEPGRAIVCLGDSITDGRGSTTDGQDRWPDRLAWRLRAGQKTADISVLNLGLGGNAVLEGGLGPAAVERFERDVFGPPGAAFLVLLEGVNDIGAGTDVSTVATRLIDAFTGFIHAAHERQIRVLGVPILPFEGSQYTGEAQQRARQIVNTWIRTSGKFDGVLDLDEAVRDEAHPERLLTCCDTGDHLHLSPEGYQRMACAVDLSLFRAD
jgi:lysophospholipase L1-like esterase